jgi:hypothetical protein
VTGKPEKAHTNHTGAGGVQTKTNFKEEQQDQLPRAGTASRVRQRKARTGYGKNNHGIPERFFLTPTGISEIMTW